jgi:hypothetical protein
MIRWREWPPVERPLGHAQHQLWGPCVAISAVWVKRRGSLILSFWKFLGFSCAQLPLGFSWHLQRFQSRHLSDKYLRENFECQKNVLLTYSLVVDKTSHPEPPLSIDRSSFVMCKYPPPNSAQNLDEHICRPSPTKPWGRDLYRTVWL